MKQSDWPEIGDFTVLYFKNTAYLQYIFFYFRFIFVI